MWRQRYFLLASGLLLMSCGSGSGSGSSGPVMPVPTPAPTPSPTPTPTFTYSDFDLSKDAVFSGQVATSSTVERYTSDVAPFYSIESQETALQASRSASELAYGANRSLTIRVDGQSVAFSSADVQSGSVDGIAWRRIRTAASRGDAASLARVRDFQYVYSAIQEVEEDVRQPGAAAAYRGTTRYFLVGQRTRDGDAPATGTSIYAITLSTTTVGRNRGGGFVVFDGTLAIDHASNVVSARLSAVQASYVTGTKPDAATLVFSGMLSPNGLNGSISSPDSSYTGSFGGDLFGPRAIETGLVLTLSRPDGVCAAGQLMGRRR